MSGVLRLLTVMRCQQCPCEEIYITECLPGNLIIPSCMPYVRIFNRCLYDLMGQKPLNVWSWHLALNEGALSELQLWRARFDRLHGAPLWVDLYVRTVLFTDAGADGWGASRVEHGEGQTL